MDRVIPNRARMAANAFIDLNNEMLWKFMELNPDCATIFGMHEPFDRHLPDGGYRKISNNLGLLVDWRARAEEIATTSELSRDQRVSLEVIRFTLDTYRFAVDDYPLWRMRPEALEHPGTAMLMMIVREYATIQNRLDAVSARLSEMPRYLEQFRGRFRGTRTARVWTESALSSSKEFPKFLHHLEKLTHAHVEADGRTKMERHIRETAEELRTHTDWLVSMLERSTDKFSMGKDKYKKLLRIRRIPYSPEELLDLATRYLEEYKRERELLGIRITGGGPNEARRLLESEHPGSMEEAVSETRDAVSRAKDFVTAHDMASMPVDSRVHVMRTPEFLVGSTPSAATYLPAVFEKDQDTVFLISGNDSPKTLGSAYNRYAIDATAVHEAYPGHHHQGVMSNRRPWVHQLPHIIYTPETTSPPYESQEGWATYCEQTMAEKGFMGSDKHLLVTLDYCIWTACRVFSEVKLSCNLASLDEMIEFTVAESGYPRNHAEADVKGFTQTPGYGICYLVGRHLVNDLKKDLRTKLGHKFSEKRFHDLVAENGNLPFYILDSEVRAGMSGADLS